MRSFLQLWFLIVPLGLFGQQQLQFEKLELPNRARKILQDQQGFIWFATDIGLLRYDGYGFKQFVNNPYDSAGIESIKTGTLAEDALGNIWLGSKNNGVYKFDLSIESSKFYHLTKSDSSKTTKIDVTQIFLDSHNRLWISTWGDGIYQYDVNSDTFTNFFNVTDSSSWGDNTFFIIHEIKPDEFWISNGRKYIGFDTKTKTFFPVIPNPPWIYQDSFDQIWTVGRRDLITGAPNNWLAKFDLNTQQYAVQEFSNIVKTPLLIPRADDGTNKLFLSVEDHSGGLAVLNLDSSYLEIHRPQLANSSGLLEGRIIDLLSDRSGIIWAIHHGMSGSAETVEIYDPHKSISHYTNYLPSRESSVDLFVSAIQLDWKSKDVWIGTRNSGLIKYNLDSGTYQQYLSDQDASYIFWPKAIFSLFQDRFGIVWIGTWGSGLYKLNPSSGELKSYKSFFEENSLGWDRIGRIFEDSKGYLWVGCLGSSLNRLKFDNSEGFEREFVSFDRYVWDAANPRGISDIRISDILEDQYSTIWIGTQNGLNKYAPLTNDFDHFLPDQNIISVSEDSAGDLWVGTWTGLFKSGLKDLNDTITFERVEIAEELIGNPMGVVGEDNKGNLWIGSTGKKIIKYHPNSGVYKILREKDGVRAGHLNTASRYLGEEMIIGGTNGFIVFHPDSMKQNPYIPPVVITDFQLDNHQVSLGDSLDGKPILTNVINYEENITLPFGHNFGFQFAALNYTNTSQNQYSYILEGFDEDWSPPSTTRTASYTNLWEGDYTFRVKGSNNDGVWNEEGAFIKVTILPPWYRSKIAWIIYGGLLLMALVYARKLIVQREREKARIQMEHMELEKAQEMDRMKTQFFTNISHEFRTPLTLILGPLKQMYEGNFKGDEHTVIGVMIRNSKRLLQLINQLLDFGKLDSGAVTLQTSIGDLVEFVRTMFSTFESTAQTRGIRYVFTSDVSSLPAYYDRDKLEKVLINLLSNAFKFTKNTGSIQLIMNRNIIDPDVDKGEGVIEIKIEDNGKGIDPGKLPHIFDRFYQADASSTRQQEGTGIGLALAKELVELHHGTIRATSKKGEGTAFIVHLPLGREHLHDSEVVVRKGYQPIDTTALEALPEGATVPMEKQSFNGDLPLVLIIDDNQDMRLYLKEVLAEQYRVAEAANGSKGWELAKEHMPDLVLSDVMMPEMDGHELCQKLKTDEHTSHIPIILLTARAGEKAKLEGLETGADDYVTKPFSPEELRARIHNLIELRQKLREQFSESVSLEPKDLDITSADQRFLKRAMDIMEIHRSDSSFSIEAFIKEIGMSRTQLHRKLKALTDQSAGDFIRSYRLKYARQLIEKEYGNMAQVAYECGFNNPSYFAECFKKQFGILPSEFSKQNIAD